MAQHCPCTYPGCSRHGDCAGCVAYHRVRNELPACYFDPAAEKTYNRSIEKYLAAKKQQR